MIATHFVMPLTAAVVPRAVGGGPDFGPFALALGSHPVAASVPAGDLPFPSSYFGGAHDLGAVENGK